MGWGDKHHPALGSIGREDRAYDPTVSLKLMDTLLTQSRALESAGWEFVALRNHERADDYPGTARGAYVLESPDDTVIDTPEMASKTAQAELRGSGEAVVTFDPNVAEDFPSIRLLLPGDPLFDGLVSMTSQSRDEGVVFVSGYRRSKDSKHITVEAEYQETINADVVLPAVYEDRRANLPEGTSLPVISEGKDIVREWMADE